MKGKSSTIAIILILLVGFPLASYLYLRKGMDFRLNAIAALEVKAGLPTFAQDTIHRVKVHYSSSSQAQVRMDSIQEHFEDRGDILYRSWDAFEAPLQDSLRKALKATGHQEAVVEEYVFLSNRYNEIVNCYSVSDSDAMSALIEHIAFLIPPDPEKDFEFIRSTEK